MAPEVVGTLCSVLRVTTTAAVLLTAFSKLPHGSFIEFSQFHVSLGFVSFIECLASIERSSRYDAGTAAQTAQRSAFVSVATLLGWCSLIAAAIVFAWRPLASSVMFSSAFALLAIPEAASLRDRPARANRTEFTALLFAVVLIGASWLIQDPHVHVLMALLAINVILPRLVISLRPIAVRPKDFKTALCVTRANLPFVSRFMGLQAVLPFASAAPAYALPYILQARDTSWILLALRGAGAISSALARQMVSLWISWKDGVSTHQAWNKILKFIPFAFTSAMLLSISTPLIGRIILFVIFMALINAVVSFLSTRLNVHGVFLRQIPAFILLWAAASLVGLMGAQSRYFSLSTEAFLFLQAGFSIAAVVILNRMTHRH